MAEHSLRTNKIGNEPKEPDKDDKDDNPVRDYLDQLVWDGVPRLNDHLAEDPSASSLAQSAKPSSWPTQLAIAASGR